MEGSAGADAPGWGLGSLNAVDLLSMGPEACKLHQAGRRYVKVDISNAGLS